MNREGAIVVSWGSANPGREMKLPPLLGKVFAYCNALQTEKKIKEVRIFVTKAGVYRDTLMLYGALDQLSRILVDNQFEALLMEGTIVVQNINIALWEGGSPEWLSTGMSSYMDVLKQNSLM